MRPTPGPWTYDADDAQILCPHLSVAVAEVNLLDPEGGEQEADANGRLIALAPMLAHLLRAWMCQSVQQSATPPERGTLAGETALALYDATGVPFRDIYTARFVHGVPLPDPKKKEPAPSPCPANDTAEGLPPLGDSFVWVDTEHPDGIPCKVVAIGEHGVAFRRGDEAMVSYFSKYWFDAKRRDGTIRPDDDKRGNWWPVLQECEQVYLRQEDAKREAREKVLRTLVRDVLLLEAVPPILPETRPPAMRMGDVLLSLDVGGFPSADDKPALRAFVSCAHPGCEHHWSAIIRSRADLGGLLTQRRNCEHD